MYAIRMIEAFERGEVPNGSFHHRDHIRLAWTYLKTFGFPEGGRRFEEALRRFAALNGKPGLYHATITWAYLVAINERLEADRDVDWDAFAETHAELFAWKPSILDRWYRPETLVSDRARRVFVMPDNSPAEPPPAR
jgi:hypothetical protein